MAMAINFNQPIDLKIQIAQKAAPWKCLKSYTASDIELAFNTLQYEVIEKKFMIFIIPQLSDVLSLPPPHGHNAQDWAGPRLNIKTVLSMYGDIHVKDKTAVRTSYL